MNKIKELAIANAKACANAAFMVSIAVENTFSKLDSKRKNYLTNQMYDQKLGT